MSVLLSLCFSVAVLVAFSLSIKDAFIYHLYPLIKANKETNKQTNKQTKPKSQHDFNTIGGFW